MNLQNTTLQAHSVRCYELVEEGSHHSLFFFFSFFQKILQKHSSQLNVLIDLMVVEASTIMIWCYEPVKYYFIGL